MQRHFLGPIPLEEETGDSHTFPLGNPFIDKERRNRTVCECRRSQALRLQVLNPFLVTPEPRTASQLFPGPVPTAIL